MAEKFNLVFAGGGVKGAAFLGALEVLKRSGHTTHRLIGTSAGAIAATCLAAGFSAEEMQEIGLPRADKGGLDQGKPCFCSFLEPPKAEDFPADKRANSEAAKFLDLAVDGALKSPRFRKTMKEKPLVGGALKLLTNDLSKALWLDALMANPKFVQFYSLLEDGALCSDRKFIAWMKDQLRAKQFDGEITLKQLHAATGRDLSLVAVDTVARELLVLNHRTAPQCPVWAAVRMSMSIPFVWQEVAWQASWGPYRGRDKTQSLIVDGGMLSNFPMRLLVDRKSDDLRQMMGEPDSPQTRNLGLYLDDRKIVPGADAKATVWNLKIAERASRLVETFSSPFDQEIVERYQEDICFIATKGFGVLEFDMDRERMQALVNSGRCAMTEYLKKRQLSFR